MARVKCPDCGSPMRKEASTFYNHDLYKCKHCGKYLMIKRQAEAYESPSSKRMRMGKEKRLADRWERKRQ